LDVIVGVTEGDRALGPLVGNGGAGPITVASVGDVSALNADTILTTDTGDLAIVVARRVNAEVLVLVIQSFGRRTVVLQPLKAALIGNGSRGEEREGDGDGDKLEVGRKHLSKMLQVKMKWETKKKAKEEWRMENEKVPKQYFYT